MHCEFKDMKPLTKALSTATLVFATGITAHAAPDASAWVASWTAAPQPVWSADFFFPTNVPAELNHQTVRQTARISLGGKRLRVVLSNSYGKQPLVLGKATVATPAEGGSVVASSVRTLTFDGSESATILPGASLVSDPVAMTVPALSQLAVSLYVPGPAPVASFHWDGRQTSWIVEGDQTTAQQLRIQNPETQSTTARPWLAGIQVESEQPARAVAVLGDSITDGATASLDKDTRWPDLLAARLAPHGVSVINAGISGARLLADGMGVNALARLDRDVLSQPGVRSVIVLLGINDISWAGTAFGRDAQRPTFAALTAGYRQLITQAHSRGVRVIGGTLTPFEGALPGTPLDDYYQPDKNALREQVNEWIRHSGAFDAVIDFDAALRDPAHPHKMAQTFDSGDHLHPGDEGNRAMADVVNLGDVLPGLNDVSMKKNVRN